jgi:hypothetical protein
MLGHGPVRGGQRRPPALEHFGRRVLDAHLSQVSRDPVRRVPVVGQRRRLDRPIVLDVAQPLGDRSGHRGPRPHHLIPGSSRRRA